MINTKELAAICLVCLTAGCICSMIVEASEDCSPPINIIKEAM